MSSMKVLNKLQTIFNEGTVEDFAGNCFGLFVNVESNGNVFGVMVNEEFASITEVNGKFIDKDEYHRIMASGEGGEELDQLNENAIDIVSNCEDVSDILAIEYLSKEAVDSILDVQGRFREEYWKAMGYEK